ncbi:MAG: hypothetical protein JXQ27_08645 [Acidobacteria bacterium]|nr:hypothetical protein [Acidobacteriota bacterium]
MGEWKVFEPFADKEEQIIITREVVLTHGLLEWADQFTLGTAGYRDLMNTENLADLTVPFNPLTMAIMTTAESRLYPKGAELHLGGEVRPWTQEFIDLATRIFAARGIICHLRGETDEDGPIRTTPIWMSSFGVFFDELEGGENFTASHSQSYKGGRKPMDHLGMQLLDGARIIQEETRRIIRDAHNGRATVIQLAASSCPLIKRDFDVSAPYVDYLKTIVPPRLLDDVRCAAAAGLHVVASTEGGSMGRTTRRIFNILNIPTGPQGGVEYLHFHEKSDYYGIGIVGGENHGVDPGKWQIYKNIGAQDLLLQGRADVVFIWDPDGDRFNMVTTAPRDVEGPVIRDGLEVEPGDNDRILVYYKPNQIYFMLLAFRLEQYRAMGLLERYRWLLLETFPTSRSLQQLADRFDVPTFFTPVGFKHFGNALRQLEEQQAAGVASLALTDVRGRTFTFPEPLRILLMAEESGGAAMGGAERIVSRFGRRTMLGLKEKDAFQMGVMALALAAHLKMESMSFAEYYVNRLEKYRITYRHYERRDLTLFDESLTGEARETARAAGNVRKTTAVNFFRGLAGQVAAGDLNTGQVTRILQERCVTGFVFPPVREIFWAGDGTFIEFEEMWWQLRASGTDAVLRYYAEGERRVEVAALNETLVRLKLDESD